MRVQNVGVGSILLQSVVDISVSVKRAALAIPRRLQNVRMNGHKTPLSSWKVRGCN
jgi:hypothetical protein